MTAFSIFVMSKFFGHFVLSFQTFRFADYIFFCVNLILSSRKNIKFIKRINKNILRKKIWNNDKNGRISVEILPLY